MRRDQLRSRVMTCRTLTATTLVLALASACSDAPPADGPVVNGAFCAATVDTDGTWYAQERCEEVGAHGPFVPLCLAPGAGWGERPDGTCFIDGNMGLAACELEAEPACPDGTTLTCLDVHPDACRE